MVQKKSLVLYKNMPAVITECGEKFTIEYPSAAKSGKAEQSVRAKDIVLLHEGPVSSLKTVLDFAVVAEKTFTESALAEVWELYAPLSGENTQPVNSEKVPFVEIADLLDVSFCADHAWGVYSYVKESPYFAVTEGEPAFYARQEQEVAALKQKNNEKERAGELREAFIKRLKAKKLDIEAGDAKFMQEVEAFALGKTDKSKLLKEAGFSESEENAHKLLVETGVWHISRNPHPSRWGLSTQSANESLSRPPEEERERIAGKAYAIDNAWSSDPDDAVAFDGENLWIHVADPASTVQPDTKIDIAARNRGSTLYIPEGAARMLSEECLEDYALGLSSLSRALSFKIKLDETGTVRECSVHKTLVEVERFTYQQVTSMKNDARFAPLFAISERNIERRKKNGAVFIELPEVHISVDMAQKPPQVSITSVSQTEAAVMVREMMLLAGEAAARFAFKNNIPFPYVSQDAPDIPSDLPQGLAGQYRLRRSMRSRSVGVTPSSHAGLGLGMYSQVTSPLRRYGDLAAHQQLRAFLAQIPLLDKDTLLERISAGDASASASVKAERKSNLHWTLVWLVQNPDWTGKAVVAEIRGSQTTLLIPELAQETQMVLSSNAQLNDEVTVRAARIDIPKLIADFVIVP